MTQGLLIAHGSPDPRHRETMQLVAKTLDARGPRCEVAFIEHDEPSVASWLADRRPATTIVALGMLLAPGFHATVDVPRLLSERAGAVKIIDRGSLGTGPWLNRTVEWLVDDAGGTPQSTVVLAVAGSTRPDAQQSLTRFADQWQRTRAGRVRLAAATGPGPSLEDVIASRQLEGEDAIVLPLMIAPGVLADRARKLATARGFRTTGTLAESPHFADVVRQRLTG